MLLDLPVVAAQPVDAEDIQQIPRPEPLEQPLIAGTVEIFPRLLIEIKVILRHALLEQRHALARLVLVQARHPDIPVCHANFLLININRFAGSAGSARAGFLPPAALLVCPAAAPKLRRRRTKPRLLQKIVRKR